VLQALVTATAAMAAHASAYRTGRTTGMTTYTLTEFDIDNDVQ
jgi:hypothetical protein